MNDLCQKCINAVLSASDTISCSKKQTPPDCDFKEGSVAFNEEITGRIVKDGGE